jgi:hypothetical protein
VNAPRREILDHEDALEFLSALDFAYWKNEYWNRLKFYDAFLKRLVAEESHGRRDGLVHAASRVFRIGVRAIRADIRAAEDRRRLEMIMKLPPRPPRSEP